MVRPNPLMSAQQPPQTGTLQKQTVRAVSRAVSPSRGRQCPLVDLLLPNRISHCVPSEFQHVRNCPIDCASIYYNGVRRSGLYTVVPFLAGIPVQVYCDMDTDGES